MCADGVYDVDANTTIGQLSEDLNIKMLEAFFIFPRGHQYETMSGFVCEAFGYIPRTGETIKVILERASREGHGEYDTTESDRQEEDQKSQIFKLEILAGDARKVGAVRFERKTHDDLSLNTKEFTRLVPKIKRRKWNSSDVELDRTETEDAPFQGICDYMGSSDGGQFW